MPEMWIVALVALCGTALLGGRELYRRALVLLALLLGRDPLQVVTAAFAPGPVPPARE